ncbi:MAG: hypothetical protein R3F59_16665 [Myxococcota bacterium]
MIGAPGPTGAVVPTGAISTVAVAESSPAALPDAVAIPSNVELRMVSTSPGSTVPASTAAPRGTSWYPPAWSTPAGSGEDALRGSVSRSVPLDRVWTVRCALLVAPLDALVWTKAQ